jgi:predicted dehydrogenase
MDRVPIAIVGCGGMGRRHLTGIAALYKSDFRNLDLVAVCDLNERNANDLADEAAQQLGARPRVFNSLPEMARTMPEIRGVDVVTDAASHHRVAVACLELGYNIQCEKPLSITQRGCDTIIEAAKKAGRILSVAENFRRDPINRLAKALIDDGAIGTPQLMIETSIGGGNRMIITQWRHQKLSGTVAMDVGVHNADIVLYYLGEPTTVHGEGRLFEKIRYRGEGAGPGGFYAKWAAQVPESFEATGEDATFAYIRFKSGAVCQWILHHAGHGKNARARDVYGSKGCLEPPGDRNGRPIKLHLDGGKTIANEEILEYAPSYKLSPVAAHLFGGERVWTYEFAFPVTDSKILALEYHELADCIATGKQPEVTGAVGRRDVALVNAMFESGVAGRPVTIEEIEGVKVDAYQREIDQKFGLA